jgi:hypothetical protein
MRERLALHASAAGVTILILAPLVRPGYVLSYDMVFVPRQALRLDLFAPAGALPRAVPEDAVVSLLSQVMPGWLLQRLVLVAMFYLAAWGAGRLVPAHCLLTRVVAAVGYAWTPFLAERLLIGQWGLLLAYAALPWLVAAAIGVRDQRPGALPRLIVAAAASAITPTGGLIALAVTAVLVLGQPVHRRALGAVSAVLVLNGPWLAASLLTAASGRSDPLGVPAFAARAENWAGPLAALAGTGGIWNAQTTPGSRASVLVPIVTAGLLVLAAFGVPVLWQRWPNGAAPRLAALAGGGLFIGLLGALPVTADGLQWLVEHVPGAGLLRDGQKYLMPYALGLAVCLALGVERLAGRLAPARRRAVLVAAALLPLAVLPDLALGVAGQLRPVGYPADWEQVSETIRANPGPVLSLPFDLYRAYPWNGLRPVIDPAPRYLPSDVLVDDTLRVGNLVVAGEDPRAAEVRDLLAEGAPVARTGVRWVLVQNDSGGTITPGALNDLHTVYNGQFLTLYENPAAAPPVPVPRRRWGIVLADVLAVTVLLVAIWYLPRHATAW